MILSLCSASEHHTEHGGGCHQYTQGGEADRGILEESYKSFMWL